ncbi:MAG: bifunctional [glutamate--ammonia ligase]-adenylyl-L-tyrosine phosphorylase/[glutamate--ammonia-ligase] adenylyltransferase [Candidatus Pelagadaptatus aseana]|uniref:bifunctional [glutamate--ammonia ligase]-adenylyl-L-tyrosine phosphorylase/[glutamate--ammonia-ligase] adenylyltransferase n=1 Tax=Candidatus Pelagadaptatus aseana TaxID=3120508 RepID=UPI0039B2EA78
MLPLDHIPQLFHPDLQQQIDLWQGRASDEQQSRLQRCLQACPELKQQLARVWVASDFVAKGALQQSAAFVDLLESGLLGKSLTQAQMAELLDARLSTGDDLDEAGFDRALRQFRRDMMQRIVWRDFCRLGSMQETVADTTHLAEVTIQAAIRFHYALLQPRWGLPIGKSDGKPQPMVVLGMGKLGGGELNVSSDIDLIFTYPQSGNTEGGRKSVSNQEFFVKLGQKVINSLDNVTVDGFVFRVDMRLRPYGQSGALVLNFDSMEEYYQTQGREWERYAMIKARVVSANACEGGAVAGEQLMTMLAPFTYRKYLDYSAIESMRSMKAMINREVKRKGKQGDVKLGAGGIREIEFVVQVFQLIRGGRDARLRERQVLMLLPLLESEGYLPEGAAEKLSSAYIFLRNAEHAIQGYQDKQTQSLPVDEKDQLRMAWTMGCADWSDFVAEMDGHREFVNSHFQSVISDPEDEQQQVSEWAEWEALWLDDLDREGLCQALEQQGFAESEGIAKVIGDLKKSRALTYMQAEGRERLDGLMPRLLKAVQASAGSAETLRRVTHLIEGVCRRTAYLVLLMENPGALQQLIRLCGASPWIAEQLSRHPALLDELLDQRALYRVPDKAELRDQLRQHMLRIELGDLEGQMEGLRYFRMSRALHVAACEVSGALPLMKVSDSLTWIAEVILEHVLDLVWSQMVSRHGEPGVKEGEPAPEFIVLGYGKMGGIELGHGSDLDLVFVHNADSKSYTRGEKSIDNQSFFIRLGQKIIHVLNTQTLSGQLYEVDMRLRPSGNSGLLVSSLSAFEKYQREEAWTWEHQALVRARVVAGGENLAREFSRLRQGILCQSRNRGQLVADVVSMREKMREHLGSKGTETQKAGQFHLKQDAGGIVDIEFLVQYAVLSRAAENPKVAFWSDNIRILGDLVAEGLMSEAQSEALISAYKAYRSAGHRLALQNRPGVVGGDEFAAERAAVKAIWQEWLGS